MDIVVQLQMLVDTDAYHTLEDNFKKLGLVRGTNNKRKACFMAVGKHVVGENKNESSSFLPMIRRRAAR